jgi:hypothetical protein
MPGVTDCASALLHAYALAGMLVVIGRVSDLWLTRDLSCHPPGSIQIAEYFTGCFSANCRGVGEQIICSGSGSIRAYGGGA